MRKIVPILSGLGSVCLGLALPLLATLVGLVQSVGELAFANNGQSVSVKHQASAETMEDIQSSHPPETTPVQPGKSNAPPGSAGDSRHVHEDESAVLPASSEVPHVSTTDEKANPIPAVTVEALLTDSDRQHTDESAVVQYPDPGIVETAPGNRKGGDMGSGAPLSPESSKENPIPAVTVETLPTDSDKQYTDESAAVQNPDPGIVETAPDKGKGGDVGSGPSLSPESSKGKTNAGLDKQNSMENKAKKVIADQELDTVDLPGMDGLLVYSSEALVYRKNGIIGKSRLLSAPPKFQQIPPAKLAELIPPQKKAEVDFTEYHFNKIRGTIGIRIQTFITNIMNYLEEHPDILLIDPDHSFVRSSGKVSATDIIRILTAMGPRSTREFLKEVDNAHKANNPDEQTGFSTSTSKEITEQAFGDALDKIDESAFGLIFALTVSGMKEVKVFDKRNVLIVDGLRRTFRRGNFEPDPDAHCDSGNKGGFDSLNIVSLLDLGQHAYRDYVIKKNVDANERTAFLELLERNPGLTGIFLLDRGFPSYEVIRAMNEYCLKYGASYLMRMKDSTGMIRSLIPNLPKGKNGQPIEFDRILKVTFARTSCQTYRDEYQKNENEILVTLDKNTPFSAIPDDDRDSVYQMEVRVVCIDIGDNKFETLITNTNYSLNQLKELYHLRWSIEVSYKSLKGIIGLNHFHFRRMDRIAKEICCRFISFNLVSSVVYDKEVLACVNTNALSPKKPLKCRYRSNFASVACDLCHFLLGTTSIECLLYRAKTRYKVKVEDNRKAPRSTVNKRPTCYNDLYY